MGIHDRNYYRDEGGGNFFSMNAGTGGRSMVIILIAINVVVFILDAFTQQTRMGGSHSIGQLSEWLSLSTDGIGNPLNWIKILTCAFAHAGPGHIFGNMLVLFFFGRPIEGIYGSKRFLWMYLTAAVGGSLIWLIVQLASGVPGSVLGASGCTSAVFILFCIHFPHQKIYLLFLPFIGIPAWIMGIFFVGSDIMGQFGMGTSNVAFLVHLVGAAYAFLFFKTKWSLGEALPLDGIASAFKSKPKLRVHTPDSSHDDRLATQADAILKKLHEQGEGSLTNRERRILEEYSRNIKQRR